MANTIKIKRGPSASLSTITLQDGEMAFTTDTKKLYISSTDEPINNNTTYSISKSGSTITLTGSDGSKTTVTDSNTTYSDATTSSHGLMTATMVTKLNGIATGANKTTVDSALSDTSTNPVQNKVINAALAGKANTSAIPTKTSQLTNDSGFKTTDNNTTYSISKSGSTITLIGSDGSTTSVTDADTNTTYSNMTAATSSAAGKAGLVPAPGAGKQASFLRGDGTWVVPTNTTYSNMTAATASAAGKAGLVPAPAAGKQTSFLRGDGTWVVPTNTTYNAATTSAAGLMSAADKTKLDGITASADTVAFTASLTSGTQIGTITINGTATKLYCQTDTNTTYSVATQSANGLMSSTDKKKLDGISASSSTPAALGTAAVGTSTAYARADHVHAAPTTVSGNAGSATKLATARTITLGTAVNATATSFDGSSNITIPVTSLKESYLRWGGTSISGDISPADAGCSDIHSANKFQFSYAAGIAIQYSRDGGNTWTDYGATDQQKIQLVSNIGNTFYIGARSTGNTVNDQLRITLTAGSMGLYTALKKLLINISTNYATGSRVKIERAMKGSTTTYVDMGTYGLAGWSGWNSIPIGYAFGGGATQTANIDNLRLTFSITGVNSDTTKSSALCVIDILGIGMTNWSNPSTMARIGHLYSFDYQQNATFPKNVSATSFTENGTTLSSKYAAKSHTHSYATVHTGTGTPAASLGNNGDIYIVTG